MAMSGQFEPLDWGAATPASARPAASSASSVFDTSTARALAGGGRVTVEQTDRVPGMRAVAAPTDAESAWRFQDLDNDTLSRMSPQRLAEVLTDLSPDVSRALWDFLRMCNPGWTVQVFRPGGKTAFPKGQQACDAFITQLGLYYGSFKIPVGYLFIGAFLRGSILGELVLDRRGRRPVDLATPDPASVRFRRVDDLERGAIWQPFQWQGSEQVPLDRATICYIPVDPLPGPPYGRAIVAPALFTALFLLGLLHDLRRVVAQQGYPRIDLVVNLEKLKAMMPKSDDDDDEPDPKKLAAWVKAAVAEVERFYAQLQPESAYVHTDAIEVKRPVGAVDSSSLGAVDGLIKALERMLVRGLKTMPLMMGTTDGVSEANANRQWEIYAAGIKSIQHLVEAMLERLLTLALQVQGIAAVVRFRFAELRAAEEERDARTQKQRQDNAAHAFDRGWISQQEAAQLAVGHDADAPAPRRTTASTPAAPTTQPDPGSDR